MAKPFKLIRWFYPGLKIKRWFLLSTGSLFFVIFSAIRFFLDVSLILKVFDIIIFVSSLLSFAAGIKLLITSFFEAVYPKDKRDIIDVIYEKRFLSKGPHIVAIGGGTGLSNLLYGLKEHTANITAIVAVADEGGSSGRIRQEFGILPPGDLRNCLVALAEVPVLMQDLFQYRFKEGGGIKGHSFGNLFITAMSQITGSFEDAIKESSRILAIRGKVLPSSLDKLRLKAEYFDGSTQEGENKITEEGKPVKRISLIPENSKANPEAISEIKKAEIIVLGPGSLFTSILPNLLIKEIAQEVAKRNVLKVYICNIMTQHGETDGFTASDHVRTLRQHAGEGVVNCCLLNSGRLKHNLLVKYAQEKSFFVIPDKANIEKMGIKVYESDIVSKQNYLRHDSQKLAKALINIYMRKENA